MNINNINNNTNRSLNLYDNNEDSLLSHQSYHGFQDDEYSKSEIEPDKLFDINNNKFIYSRNSFVIISGFRPIHFFLVVQYFHKFGKVKQIDYKNGNDYMIIQYADFNYSSIAINHFDPFLLNEHNSIITCSYYNNHTHLKNKNNVNNINRNDLLGTDESILNNSKPGKLRWYNFYDNIFG